MSRGLLLTVLMLGAAVAAYCGPAEDLGATAAGKRALAYVQAFNSGDDGQMRAFLQANISEAALAKRGIDERLAMFHRLSEDIPGMELAQVVRTETNSLSIEVKDRKGEIRTLTFQYEAQAPFKIEGIGIEMNRGEGPGAGPAGPPVTEAAALDSIERWLTSKAAADMFSGAVLIAKDGLPVLRKAWGLADREHRVPNTVETRFNVASIGKSFTRIAVEGLIAQGKLAATDKLGKFLPDYPNADARDKVTVKQLLDMRSGIGDFFGKEFLNTPRDRIRSLKDYLPLFAGKPLLFEPGTAERYSNGGYVVLGLIIEKVTGRSYYDYVQETVFNPAGMTRSGWFGSDEIVPDRATGYTHGWNAAAEDSPELRSNVLTKPGIGSSAGGGYSTVDDLLNFVNALQTNRLQSSEGGAMGIAGGAPGTNGAVESGIPGGYTVIVLCNADPPQAEDAAMTLRQWLIRVRK